MDIIASKKSRVTLRAGRVSFAGKPCPISRNSFFVVGYAPEGYVRPPGEIPPELFRTAEYPSCSYESNFAWCDGASVGGDVESVEGLHTENVCGMS